MAGKWALCIGLISISAWGNDPVHKTLDNQSKAGFSKEHGLHVDIQVEHASELEAALRIYTGYLDQKKPLPAKGIDRRGKTKASISYRNLSPIFQRSMIKALWPKSGQKNGDWEHRVTYQGHETLWTLCELLTGSGANYKKVMKENRMRSSKLKLNQKIRFPGELVLPHFLPKVQPQIPEDPVTILAPITDEVTIQAEEPLPKPTDPQGKTTQKVTHSVTPSRQNKRPGQDSIVLKQMRQLEAMRGELQFGSDAQGKYAIYRLKRGEAIYSAVVVRFCGLVSGEDVNREAQNIIQRNGIRDETDLAVGTPIKIPYELLEPEFKSLDDPEYQSYLANLDAVSRVETDTESPSVNLQGVYVILDSGHGGRDPGAKFGSVWEDDYVYDIMCRIKLKLESETGAQVITTTLDPSVHYKVQDVRSFSQDQDEVLLTHPRYHLSSRSATTDGVNLRWMLVNDQYAKLKANGVKPEKMVFASLHADSLHRSIRGAMVYIPDARYYPSVVGPPVSRFQKYSESKSNHFRFSKKELESAQARSMVFAQTFLRQARSQDILIHRDKPIRSVIFRRARSKPFVPAVIKYNRVPTRLLIEVCNLNNAKDRDQLRDPKFRQKFAESFVEALHTTFDPRSTSKQTLAQKSR